MIGGIPSAIPKFVNFPPAFPGDLQVTMNIRGGLSMSPLAIMQIQQHTTLFQQFGDILLNIPL
jgi:hypothetical protein